MYTEGNADKLNYRGDYVVYTAAEVREMEAAKKAEIAQRPEVVEGKKRLAKMVALPVLVNLILGG